MLGIDPGTAVTGYGVVEPALAIDRPGRLVECGVIRTDPKQKMWSRLETLYDGVSELIARHRPSAVAIETVFYGKNARSTLTLGHARGVILLCIRRAGLGLVELKPTEVKRFMTGNGHASKAQMQAAVGARLGLAAPPEPPDVADALAVALCAGWRAAPDTPAGASLRRLSARAR